MRKLFFPACLCFCMLSLLPESKAQVVSVTNPTFTTPNLAATYTSLANAVTALQAVTAISGPVIITLNPGNPQTAPVGGYFISFTATTTTARNITFSGNNNVITSNSSLVSGILTDAIFKIVGGDFVTIQNFTMRENAANITATPATNDMTEWGVALLCASSGNGAQNNTIKNNTISLNKTYSNSFGIYSNTRHTLGNVTTEVPIINNTAAPNKGNKVYGNAISNVNAGITFLGSGNVAFMDTGNDIGGTSPATGNTITNWGSNPFGTGFISNLQDAYGIYVNHQKDENVSFNTIVGVNISAIGLLSAGIIKNYSTTEPTGTFTSEITNNTITFSSTSQDITDVCGIYSGGIISPLSTATININSNLLLNISYEISFLSSVSLYGILNRSRVGILNINDNILRGTICRNRFVPFVGILNRAAIQITLNINNNQLGNNSGNGISYQASAGGTFDITGISNPFANPPGANISISGNNFQGLFNLQRIIQTMLILNVTVLLLVQQPI